MIATAMNAPSTFHPLLRWTARVISVIFHPLFIPVYMGWFFVYGIRLFPQLDEWTKTKLMLSFGVNYMLLPLITLLLAKALGFIQSIFLNTQKDRIIPYVATGIFYFWVWYVFKNQNFPREVVMFALAVFLASSLGLIVNSYIKVSMHAISFGVVALFMMILGFTTDLNYGPYIALAFFIAGLVCTARLINNDHRPAEVYAGLLVGAIAQGIAFFFV